MIHYQTEVNKMKFYIIKLCLFIVKLNSVKNIDFPVY